jgi:hypothetical protein
MLREEQAAELLRRCESLAGVPLSQTRGNLRQSKSRAAAIWELLVFEEMSRLGDVAYEPHEGASPDLLLTLPSGKSIWVEAAFLYPRFGMEERQSEAVVFWVAGEASRLGIPPFKISCNFEGDRTNPAGPVRLLPKLNQGKVFLHDATIQDFFRRIIADPGRDLSFSHKIYSVELQYEAVAKGPYSHSGGGLIQESPKNVRQHALYRALKLKARQHRVPGMRIICIGSDRSTALSEMMLPGRPKPKDAVSAVFAETQSISAVVTVRIECVPSLPGLQRRARSTLYLNPHSREPLTQVELEPLQRLNFNRWRYYYPMPQHKRALGFSARRLAGSLTIGSGGFDMRLEVPATIVVECLAGRTNLFHEYGTGSNDPLDKALRDGWSIQGCSWKEGDVEAGEAPKIVLELQAPPEQVFGTSEAVHKEDM